jgi:hypothetical protein
MRLFQSSLLTRVKVGLFAGALAATALGPALPAHAASGTISISPATTSVATVAAGATINVDVMGAGDGTTPIRGWQIAASWNPAVVTLTTVNYTDELLNGGKPTGASIFNQAGTIDNTAGTLGIGGDTYLGGTGGPTGSGRLAQLVFHAVANGTTAITLTPGASTGSILVGPGTPNPYTTTLNNGTINVGPVPGPDLKPINAATHADSTDPTKFTVTFNVQNIGNQDAVASVASVAVTGATPASATVNVPALAQGVTSAQLTSPTFTLASGSTLANVTITADSTHVVTGNKNTSPTTTTSYQHAALNSTGTTPIDATLAGFLQLTAPGAVTGFTLTAGKINTESGHANDVLNVKANVDWNVTVSGDNNGKLTEFDGTSYVTPGAQLINALGVRFDSQPDVNLSGSAQAFVSGTRAGSDPNIGNNYGVAYDQFVGYNDTPVNAPHDYHIVVTWAASGTF